MSASNRQARTDALLAFFKRNDFEEPHEDLMQSTSNFAEYVAGSTEPSPERTLALRKLLEVRDELKRCRPCCRPDVPPPSRERDRGEDISGDEEPARRRTREARDGGVSR